MFWGLVDYVHYAGMAYAYAASATQDLWGDPSEAAGAAAAYWLATEGA